jgi:hypothetical protein
MKRESKVAAFLSDAIDKSEKLQREICDEIGYEKHHILSAMKAGRTPVPIAKVPALAKSLELDPLMFLRIVMEEYQPENWKVIESVAKGSTLSASELALVKTLRKAVGSFDLKITPAEEKELITLLKSWKAKRK